MAGIVEAADAAPSADAPAPALSELEQQFQAKSDFVHQWTTGKKATTEEKLNACALGDERDAPRERRAPRAGGDRAREKPRPLSAFPPPAPPSRRRADKFFKQGTVGDVNIERPSMFNFEGKSKWDAWNSIKGMVKDDAMKNYIEEIDRQHAKYGD